MPDEPTDGAGASEPVRAPRVRVPVPPIGLERQHWAPSAAVGYTRRERSGTGAYRSAVPAEIADLTLALPAELVADSEDAAAEIARFDASSQHTIGAVTAVLLRSESSSSSQIEQITASARAIAEAELTGLGSGNAVGIVDNMHAMAEALQRTDHLTVDGIAEIQRTLLARHAPRLVGWRAEPVWVGGRGSTPVTADFVAPDHRRILAALEDLVTFAGRDDLPVLPQIAVAHAQFETIHPFADGNGRTGRALVHLMLRSKQLVRTATVPISGGLLVGKDTYFEALGAYRAGDAAPIVDELNHAALRSVHQGRRLIDRMSQLRDTWRATVRARSDSTVWRIIDLLPGHPVLDAETIARRTGVHAAGVRRSVAPLLEAGILVASQHFKSHKQLYRAPAVLDLLDDYATEVGRRQR
ncbi:Fic family protein [Microlunatus spumicola]|uniref:Fic family protein n=1 Tax=Microlunatus spumicola TaxID=81499 RepID=UPI001956FBA0